MKTLRYYFVVLVLLVSCSDSSEVIFLSDSSTVPTAYYSRGTGTVVANPMNPYDISGKLHTDLYIAYYATDTLISSTMDVATHVTQLANANLNFVSLSGAPYVFLYPSTVSSVLDPNCSPSSVITAALGNTNTACAFSAFISSLLTYSVTESDFAPLYSYIVSYEATVLDSTAMTASEKQLILTSTSIMRYSLYEQKRKPKHTSDPEWDLLVAHFMGSIVGASTSIEDAVVLALICGVVENGLVGP